MGVVPVKAAALKFDRKMYKVTKTGLAMGTFVSMTLIDPSRDKAEQAMGLAFEEIDRLARSMSRFDESAAVGLLNRDGFLEDVPAEVSHVVTKGLDYYRVSRGAFDMTVKPIVDLFKEAFAEGKVMGPSEKDMEGALGLVGSDKIEVNGRALRLKRPGMGITLDGIAKGYIVDRASEILAGYGIQNHLINAGGDIRTMGVRDDKKPWTIAIEDPQKRNLYPDKISMTGGAIATSGNYEIFFDREKMFHHIVDPMSGQSPYLTASVSVMADTALEADALSTGVFVMGSRAGVRFIDAMPGCECLVIDRGRKIAQSRGWKRAAI
jgi:thiamine biosynthesis lipoprotein